MAGIVIEPLTVEQGELAPRLPPSARTVKGPARTAATASLVRRRFVRMIGNLAMRSQLDFGQSGCVAEGVSPGLRQSEARFRSVPMAAGCCQSPLTPKQRQPTRHVRFVTPPGPPPSAPTKMAKVELRPQRSGETSRARGSGASAAVLSAHRDTAQRSGEQLPAPRHQSIWRKLCACAPLQRPIRSRARSPAHSGPPPRCARTRAGRQGRSGIAPDWILLANAAAQAAWLMRRAKGDRRVDATVSPASQSAIRPMLRAAVSTCWRRTLASPR